MEHPRPGTASYAGPSQSLLGSLCREMASIHARRGVLTDSLMRCQSPALVGRLHGELTALALRQRELAAVADSLSRRVDSGLDSLSVAFFRELTRRQRLE